MRTHYPGLAALAWLGTALGAAGAAKLEGISANIEQGQRIYDTCIACHAALPSGPTGPNLRGVFGRKAGEVPGFPYSRALKNSKIVWNATTLDAFLADPQAAVPGNLMPFPGLPDDQARLDLIAFLKTLK